MKDSKPFCCSLFFAVALFIAGFALLIIEFIFSPDDYKVSWRLGEIGYPAVICGVVIWCASLLSTAIASIGSKQD